MTVEGVWPADSKALTMTGDGVDGFTGKPVKVRTVTSIVNDTGWLIVLPPSSVRTAVTVAVPCAFGAGV